MSEGPNPTVGAESPGAHKASAPKDRNCPYCGQAFTSSSLGRHLDLYIKEKNPKPPDGIHDVDAIRKMRGSITRRQPRGSLAHQKNGSAPGTPTASSRRSPGTDSGGVKPSAMPKDGQFVVDKQTAKYPFQPTWESTGVINDIPTRNGELKSSFDEGAGQDLSRRPGLQRAPSRTVQKSQLDARQKLVDAMDTARAAELALRELLSSWRAAKLIRQQIDMDSLPFDFDPLSLDFPALTLQCLQAPPTLFSSTPHPTPTSWSIQPPAKKQFDALQTYFQEEFRRWRVTCSMATTASSEDLTFPPSENHAPRDVRESVKKAEGAAAALEAQVREHLQSAYNVWEQLPAQRKTELWGLELARSVGRKQKDVEKLKESQHLLKQENANLKTQIDQLNRLQQPREFRIVTPTTFPIEQSLLSYLLDMGYKGRQGVGLHTEDRHVDLDTVVSRAIDRWKSVIVSTRGVGMAGQRSLEQATPTPTSTTSNPTPAPPSQPAAANPQQQPPQPQRSVPTPTTIQQTDIQPVTTVVTAPSASIETEDNSDQDADAEMEDDESFTPITPIITKPLPTQQQHQTLQQQQLEMPRTRGREQQMQNARFAMNGAAPGRGGIVDVRQTMQNMNNVNVAATSMPARMHAHGHAMMNNGDYGAAVVQGVTEPMYMD
ncbi:hypothetical protein GGS23DRAFT_146588 [Durotheca rogersii]|uniref:uncharacterized protein n=1 Tax=Durotheca rogersii TaxID=419775 RepID=UPI0022206DD1|nr:uncharacterized protein GGS23DRAFT_146588 [Durotheca rogersii]KAI5861329.1 hypothetical protein GGS23DRAFT_146588 [Durotheca rogersii]